MARHRLRHDYQRSALIAAMVFNMSRDPKKADALDPSDLNPYAATKEPEPLLEPAPEDWERWKAKFANG